MSTCPPENSIYLHHAQLKQWWHFTNPQAIYQAHTLADVWPALQAVEQQVNTHGLYAAGFVNYEAAPAFDPALTACAPAPSPLLWFGLYAHPNVVAAPPVALPPGEQPHWQPSITEAQYQAAIARIKDHIAAGDTYQVNFSFRLRTPWPHDAEHAWAFFARMVRAQGAGFSAFIHLPHWVICSASPELFFMLDGNTLTSRPMKGTAPRGLWPAADVAQATALQNSEKNRAENVMIVDMVRNDLARVAQLGSVRVPELFALERYPTLWQLTSTVTAQTEASFSTLWRALFPAASITGAPKARTSHIIAALETSPRQIYTGSIGFLAPQRQAQFNVAIRTVLIDKRAQTAEYGTGGGVVWDSTPEGEFAECATKAQVLTHTWPEFQLLESLRWTPDVGFFLLERHLTRLVDSAEYFGFALDVTALRERLAQTAPTWPAAPQKIRILLAKDGVLTIEAHPLTLAPLPPRHPHPSLPKCALAPHPVQSTNVFLYHKTTYREPYNQALAARPGFDAVLLWNEREELTEGNTANVMVEWDGQWYTPPIDCGLLAGTYRAELLEQGRVQERVIRVSDLAQCTRVCLMNSVRGEWEVEIGPGRGTGD